MTDVRESTAPTTSENSGPNPVGDFIWYELMTPDPDASKAFYDAVVGWDIGPGIAEYNGYRMIGRSDGRSAGGILPITDEMRQRGARPTWLGYLNVDDVDGVVKATAASGGEVLLPPMGIPNIGRTALVRDPQGAAFYVMKPIPPAGHEKKRSDVFSPDAEQHVSWNELSTSDPAAARAFYGDQFGWVTNDFMDMGETGQYRFIDHHGLRIGALCGTMPGGQSKWRYYFRVPSISAAKDVAEHAGGTIAMGPHQVPGGDWIIIGSDPQGAEFALVGGK